MHTPLNECTSDCRRTGCSLDEYRYIAGEVQSYKPEKKESAVSILLATLGLIVSIALLIGWASVVK